MQSRMEKYYNSENQYKRTTKNASLYKEVYKSYSNVETLPIADNTNEIDVYELKQLVKESQNRTRRNQINYEAPKKIEDRQEIKREYDINKILEKVKNDNDKNKEKEEFKSLTKRNYLTTLSTEELNIANIKEKYLNERNKKIEEEKADEQIYLTRELKFKDKQLEVTREIQMIKQEELNSPLDLFQDLKPSGNTFITEPVKQEENNIFATSSEKNELDIKFKNENSKEDCDIDILKKEPVNQKTKEEDDEDFYTDSHKFSKKDFIEDDDDFYDIPKKSSGVLKIILLLALILALSTTIYYFINKYGIGI